MLPREQREPTTKTESAKNLGPGLALVFFAFFVVSTVQGGFL